MTVDTEVCARIAYGRGSERSAYPDDPARSVTRRLLAALRPRVLPRLVARFYADRIAWLALGVSALLLAYAGGAVLFWFHAYLLGEGGPAISPIQHWLLDSSAGFIGLTPALFVILPLAAYSAIAPTGSSAALRIRPGRYALVGGTLFALVTAPGPLLHNALIGRGTWVANGVTEWLGDGRPVTGTSREYPALLDMGMQVAAALPLYITLMWITLVAMRFMIPRD